MNETPPPRIPRLALALMLLPCAACPSAVATEATPLRAYEVTTETGMPHLEENLRYAVVRETRCLDRRDLSSAFWMLKHESLQDCSLNKAADHGDSATYLLVCTGGHGTTGNAVWQLGADRLSGTLNVKLGGKNMTFYQRVVAKPLAQAAAQPASICLNP
jgi:hypothetical protein